MPKFFFDVECNEILAGRASASLPDLETAENYAAGFADVIMGTSGADDKPWSVLIKTERGQVIQVVRPNRD